MLAGCTQCKDARTGMPMRTGQSVCSRIKVRNNQKRSHSAFGALDSAFGEAVGMFHHLVHPDTGKSRFQPAFPRAWQ